MIFDLLEAGQGQSDKPDEFGQSTDQNKNIKDLGRLRSFLNNVSDYSKASLEPPSIMCEGQGSTDNQDREKSNEEEVIVPSVKPIFKQFLKRGFHNMELDYEMMEQQSLDSTAIDINSMILEIDTKLDEVNEATGAKEVDKDKQLEEKK